MQTGSIAIRQPKLSYFTRKARGLLLRLVASFQVHAILFALVAIYVALVYQLNRQAGTSVNLNPAAILVGDIATIILPMMLFGAFIARLFRMIAFVRPEHPIKYLFTDFVGNLLKPTRFAIAIPTTIAVIYFTECYSNIKDLIPLIKPFSWDVTFRELDQTLHFGVDPWRLLQPVLGHWWITTFINFIYNIWFFVIWFVLVSLTFSDRNMELRLQYFVTFILVWMVGGSLLAIQFSSAGPAFYERLGFGSSAYGDLMEYLRQTNLMGRVWAVKTQDMLWASYLNDNKGLVSGISAMPSMHNATAVVVALLGWRVSRFAGIAGTVFATTILLGSVHLGWHYAVDGYLGILIALGAWWYAGLLVRWYLALPFIQRSLEILHESEQS